MLMVIVTTLKERTFTCETALACHLVFNPVKYVVRIVGYFNFYKFSKYFLKILK